MVVATGGGKGTVAAMVVATGTAAAQVDDDFAEPPLRTIEVVCVTNSHVAGYMIAQSAK
jgi:hypothetical protein